MQTQPLHNYQNPKTSTNNKSKHAQQHTNKYQQQLTKYKHKQHKHIQTHM